MRTYVRTKKYVYAWKFRHNIIISLHKVKKLLFVDL